MREEYNEHFTYRLENNLNPYYAHDFLANAKSSIDIKGKIINSAIAAELAVKEFLSSINPETRILLTYLPSPPIYRLYGEIFNKYTGIQQRFPFKKLLEDLQDERNKMVHRAENYDIDAQLAEDYILIVSNSIRILEEIETKILNQQDLTNIEQNFEELNQLPHNERRRILFRDITSVSDP